MSRPDLNTLRPVNTDRAAPTRKWESIANVNDMIIAVDPFARKNGKTGMIAPNAVASPVTHASRHGEIVCSPILSSSCTCSSSMRSGSAITSVASL